MWANIKHTKAPHDTLRGAMVTRRSRELIVAARSGGDPAADFVLPDALMAELSSVV